MDKKMFFTILAAGVAAMSLSARQLDPSEALRRAEMSVTPSEHTPLSMTTGQQPMTLRYTATDRTDDLNTVYVFSRGDNGGFVVVAADDTAPYPLLGYADSGEFDAANMPPAMEWWLGEYSSELASLAKNDIEPLLEEEEEDTRASIAPIVKTMWNQTTPFNNYCPTVQGVRCPSGCVATAMAQVMSVFKYPEKGVGEHSYTPYDVGYPLTMSFENTTFEWDKMLDSYNEDSPAENDEAVANLMYALGVSVNMQYTPTSSGGSIETAAVSLVKYFNYDEGLQVYQRDFYGLERWINAIYAELEAGRPVLYGGRNGAVGHCFVLDGYRTGEYFHVNWGWGGMSNGYFRITSLNPALQGVGGSAEGYNRSQEMVIGIQPPVGADKVAPRVVLRGDLTTDNKTYMRTDDGSVAFRCNIGFICQSVETITLQMGVKCVNEVTGDSVLVMDDEWHSMSMNSGLMTYNINMADLPQTGVYNVSSGFKTEDGTWYNCLVRLNQSGTLKMTATEETLAFGPVDDDPEISVENFELASPVYSGKPVLVNASLHVEGRELLDNVRPVLLSTDDETVVALGEIVEVDVPAGETVAFSWEGTMSPSFKTGNYKLQLKSDGYGLIGPSVDVTVKPTPTSTPKVTGSVEIDGGTHGQSADDIAHVGTNARVKISVTCTQGYFASPACAWIYYDDSRQVRGLGNKFIALDSAQTYTRDFTTWLGDLKDDHVYMLKPWALNYGVIGNPVYFQKGLTGIEQIKAEDVGIWPNPAVSNVTLTVDRPIERIEIFSLSGAPANRVDGAMQTSVEFNVDSLPPGLYIVKATCHDGSVRSYKLIKR